MANFDVKRVTPLEWAGIGAGAFAFIVSFFSWYSVSYDSPISGFDIGGSVSAWNSGFLAWFSVLLLVAAAVIVLLPHFGTAVPNRALVWLILSGLAFVFILLRWITFEDFGDIGVSAGAGFGLFLGLLAALVSGVAGFLTYRGASSRTSA